VSRPAGVAALRLCAALAVALLIALGGASGVFARAGGAGGHSSGGSRSSGGGFRSGGSSFRSGSGRSRSGSSTPMTPGGFAVIAIVIVGLIVFFIVRGRLARRGLIPADGGGESGGAVTEEEPEGPIVDAPSLAAFRTAHPGFDEPAFKQKVRRGFNKIQTAWTAQQLAGVRAFISDGLYQRFATQFAMMKLLQQTNVLDAIRLRRVELACAWQDGAFDVIEVYVEASMRDAFVCGLDHSLDMSGESAFAEYWSFIRAQKAPDPRGDLYDAATCPACSAPLPKDLGEVGACAYCHALVNSGEYDWILAEITQQADYGARAVMGPLASRSLPQSVSQLRQQIPAFSVQLIEDKASNAFLQIMTVLATRNPALMRRFVSDRAFEQIAALIPPDPIVFNRLYLNESVLLDAGRAGECHRLAVGLSVTLQRVRVLPEGRLEKIDAQEVQRRHVLILERDVAAAAGAGALYQHQCSSCGAPVADSLDVKCGYCGSALNSTSREWIVEELLTQGEYEKRRRQPS
jgi:uncharacterized Zn finger protein (UPF0148 family)